MSIELRALERSDLPAATELLTDACAHDLVAPVAEEKIFGSAPNVLRSEAYGAFAGRDLAGLTVASGAWLRLLAVHPQARRQGVGTALLAAAESAIAATGAETARTLDQPGNYLAPGIDVRNTETLAWLERRGYYQGNRNTNLLIDVAANRRVSIERVRHLVERAGNAGYRLRRASPNDAAVLADTVGRGFSTSWAFEIERALHHRPSGVHIAEVQADGSLAAFAAHDGNNRGLGWFGPAGTLEGHRRQGLGEALLVACLIDVAAAGRDRCEVAWIGPRAFYERAAGVAAERHFVVMKKELCTQ